MNHINGSVADKDRRIRKLQEELAVLRRQLEGLRTDYNHKFVAALNELGFDAEEITESGEIKFAVRWHSRESSMTDRVIGCAEVEYDSRVRVCRSQDGLVLHSVFAESGDLSAASGDGSHSVSPGRRASNQSQMQATRRANGGSPSAELSWVRGSKRIGAAPTDVRTLLASRDLEARSRQSPPQIRERQEQFHARRRTS